MHAHLPTYWHACIPTYLHTGADLHTYLRTYIPTDLPTWRPTCLATDMHVSPTNRHIYTYENTCLLVNVQTHKDTYLRKFGFIATTVISALHARFVHPKSARGFQGLDGLQMSLDCQNTLGACGARVVRVPTQTLLFASEADGRPFWWGMFDISMQYGRRVYVGGGGWTAGQKVYFLIKQFPFQFGSQKIHVLSNNSLSGSDPKKTCFWSNNSLCLCVNMCAYVSIYGHMCTYVHACMRICVHTCAYL